MSSRSWTLHARWAAALSVVAVAVSVVTPSPSLRTQLLFALGPILVLGVPHGALDLAVARSLGLRRTAAVAGCYVALGALTVITWALAPTLALAGFLALSVVHFGLGDLDPWAADEETARPLVALEAAVRGALPVVLPVAFRPLEVAPLFAWLSARGEVEVAAALSSWAVVAGVLWSVGAAALLALQGGRRALRTGVELSLLAATFALLPPLLAFAVYFCFWHAMRHLLFVAAFTGAPARGRAIRVALVTTGATLALGLAAYASTARSTVDLPALTRVLFVGLAALTVPHAALTFGAQRLAARRAAATTARSA